MFKNLALITALCLLVGCASTNNIPADPFEGMNRVTFEFNDKADQIILQPLAKGYRAVTPQFVRAGVVNVFGNVADVATGVNNLLQGKPASAASDLSRVMVNSTLGILGLFDVASPMGLAKHEEDFGQTLGKWGVGSGPYLVLPFMGPSTLRDAVARYPDGRLSYGRQIDHVPTRNSTFGLDIINIRAELLDASKTLEEAALDKYQFLRDAFLQRRLNQVHDGKVPSALREKLVESLEVPFESPTKANSGK